MPTAEVLLASWLVQDDDEADDDYAARLAAPMPFIPTDENGDEQ